MADNSLQVVLEWIEKNTSTVAKITGNIAAIDKDIKSLDTDTKTLSKTNTNTWTELNSLISVAQRAIQKLKQGYDFAKEGAQLEYQKSKFDRLAVSIGSAGDALLMDMKVATRGTLSDFEAMNAASDLLSLGLAKNSEEAVRLASVQTGLGMDINQLVLTLTNQTTMRFDALGVSVDGFKEKVKALEEQGMDANEAFKEAFLQQAEDQLEKVGNAADSASGTFLRLEAHFKDLRDEAKQMASDGLSPLIESWLDSVDAGEKQSDVLDLVAQKYGITRDQLILAQKASKDFAASIPEEAAAWQIAIDTASSFDKKVTDITGSLETLKDEGPQAPATLEEAFKNMLDSLYPVADEMDVLIQRSRGVNRASEEAKEPVGGLTDEVKALAGQAHNAAMTTGSAIAQLKQLDGMVANATVNISVNGSIPSLRGLGGLGVTGGSSAGAGAGYGGGNRPGGGPITMAEGGTVKNGLFVVGEQGFEAGIRNKDGSVTIIPHDVSKKLADLGVLGNAPGFLFGGEIGPTPTSSGYGAYQRQRRQRRDETVTTGGTGGAQSETSVQQIPVTTLTNVVTQEVNRLGSSVVESTVANVTATQQQTNVQTKGNQEMRDLLNGIRRDLQRNRTQNLDDLRQVLQGIV